MAPYYVSHVDPLLGVSHRRRCESYSSGLLVSQEWKDLEVSLALLLHEERGIPRGEALYDTYFPKKTMESSVINCTQEVSVPSWQTVILC
jgi:hypothetical protein